LAHINIFNMAFEFNGRIAVTQEELIPGLYSTYDNLKKTLQRYKDKPYGIKRLMVGGNGRQLLIDFDSLPREYQEQLPDPRKCDHIMERFYKTDGDAVRFFSTFKFDDGTYLKQEHQEQYITNASVLKSAIALREARIKERRSKRGSIVGIAQTVCSDVESFNKTLLKKHRVEHNLPGSLVRFKAALKAFETPFKHGENSYQFDYSSLISAKHKNQNSRKVDEHTLKLLKALFTDVDSKPTATKVHRQYEAFLSGYLQVTNVDTAEIYNPKDYKKLSDATVKSYLTKWENRIDTHKVRSGDRQVYMGDYKPYFSFDKPKYAGSIISIDDRNPPFKAENGKRIWFYNGIDLGSEAFTCWVYGETKDGIITEFYRQMVRNYAKWGVNIPAELECELSLNSSFAGTFLQEGAMFEYIKMESNNARGKRIENYFRQLRYGPEKERLGWLARPKARAEANQQAVEQGKTPTVPYDKIIEGCLQDIEDWNNEPHSEHTHLSRWDVFMQMQHPDVKPTNYLSFIRHIGYRTETSCRVGNIKLDSGLCLIGLNGEVATGGDLIHLMKAIEGRLIEVYWLDDYKGDILKAYAYIDDQLICELVPKPHPQKARLEQTDKDRKNLQILAAYTKTVEQYGTSKVKQLDEVVLINKAPKRPKTFSIKDEAAYNRPLAEECIILPSVEFDAPTITTYNPIEESFEDRF
jgi:hypothetical protein